jgi:hypothetical protein
VLRRESYDWAVGLLLHNRASMATSLLNTALRRRTDLLLSQHLVHK